MKGPHTEETVLHLEIQKLRERLTRRNALLDSVRKAYHHDVVILKEYLMQLRNEGKLDLDCANPLESIPSLDLRPALKLFAPAECELRLRPCAGCGGQLEIVHQESARIVNLQRACAELQAIEQELRIKGSHEQLRAERERAELAAVREKSRKDISEMKREIGNLEQRLRDYDSTKEECKGLRLMNSSLKAENDAQKNSLSVLDTTRKELAKSRDEVACLRGEIETQVNSYRDLSARFTDASNSNDILKGECHKILSEVADLKEAHTSLQEQLSITTAALSECQSVRAEVEARLEKYSKKIDSLNAEIKNTETMHQNELSKKEFRNQRLNDMIGELEMEVRKQETEKNLYRQKIDEVTQSLNSQVELRRGHEEEASDFGKELMNLSNKIRSVTESTTQLTNFACSYARTAFDHCIAQELIVANEGCELPDSRNKRPTNGILLVLSKHLDRGCDSGSIDWDEVMDDDTTRRQVLGFLSNRLQMGVFSIKKVIDGLHKKRDNTKRRMEEDHENAMADMQQDHVEEIQKLRESLEKCDAVRNKCEEDLGNMSSKYLDTKKEFDTCNHNLNVLQDKYNRQQILADGLCEQLTKSNAQLSELNEAAEKRVIELNCMRRNYERKVQEINERDQAIAKLELLMERTTERYARLIEKERLRLETNQSVSLQAKPNTLAVASQADFVVPQRNAAPARKKKTVQDIWPFDFVNQVHLPARESDGVDEKISLLL